MGRGGKGGLVWFVARVSGGLVKVRWAEGVGSVSGGGKGGLVCSVAGVSMSEGGGGGGSLVLVVLLSAGSARDGMGDKLSIVLVDAWFQAEIRRPVAV